MEAEARTLQALFPHRICINLDRRPERWARMQARFAELGLEPVERLPAVDGTHLPIPAAWPYSAGAYGCLRSHLQAIRQARERRQKQILILEDDVVFHERFHEEFARAAADLPEDWDMLFFGCLHFDPPTLVTERIGRLRTSFSTFMYAVRHTVYDAFEFLNRRERFPVDKNNVFLQRRYRCYCFLPHLAWVDDCYSDAQGLPSTHWYIRDSMALGGEGMKALEKTTVAVILHRSEGNQRRAARNLRFLVRSYRALFTVLVIDQDKEFSLPPGTLAGECDYLHLPGEDHGEAWPMALERYGREKDHFIITESHVVSSRMEWRASLSKCADFDVVASFAQYFDLNETDSDRLLSGQSCQAESYAPRGRRERFREFFTATKAGLQSLCEGRGAPAANPKTSNLRVFDSPGSAVCLAR